MAELIAYRIDDIDDIVARFLEIADDIHIVDAGLILVMLVVDVLDIGASENVAHVVDLAFLVV